VDILCDLRLRGFRHEESALGRSTELVGAVVSVGLGALVGGEVPTSGDGDGQAESFEDGAGALHGLRGAP